MMRYLIKPITSISYTEKQRKIYHAENNKIISQIGFPEIRIEPEIYLHLNKNSNFYDNYTAQAQYKWSANVSHLLYDVLSDHFVIRELVGSRQLICRSTGLIDQIVEFLGSDIIPGEFPADGESCFPDVDSRYSFIDLGGWRHAGHKHSYLSSIIQRTFSRLQIVDPSYPKNILINRKKRSNISRNRNIDNLFEFREKAKILGIDFHVLELDDIPLSEQIKFFFNADKILSIHGSGLVWLNFCQKNAQVVEVLPPWFVNDGYHKHDFWVIGNNANLNYKSLYVDQVVGDLNSSHDIDVVLNPNVIYDLFQI